MDNMTLYASVVSFIESKDKNNSFNEIFNKFEPLLIKYALKLNDIDLKYDLAMALYECLLKIPIELENFKHDPYILKYIETTIFRGFLKLKQDNARGRADYSLDVEFGHKTISSNGIESGNNTMLPYNDPFFDIWCGLLFNDIKSALTKEEYGLVVLRAHGFSQAEIARNYSITRQAVCNRMRKIRKKINKFLDEDCEKYIQ